LSETAGLFICGAGVFPAVSTQFGFIDHNKILTQNTNMSYGIYLSSYLRLRTERRTGDKNCNYGRAKNRPIKKYCKITKTAWSQAY